MMQDAPKQNDYAVSKFLTSPGGKALSSAAATGALMLAMRRGVKSKAIQNAMAKYAPTLGRPVGPSNKAIATTAALSGGLSGVFANAERDLYASALKSKLESGRGGFTNQEKNLLVGKGANQGSLGGQKGFSEYYITPHTHGIGRAALGFLLGGPAGALTEGASGAVGTGVSRHMWARALKGRIQSGDKLTKNEQALANTLGLMRGGAQ